MTGPHRSITVAIAGSNWLSLCAVSPAGAAESPYLVGDWNGNRTSLADEGISFHIGYDSEAARNPTAVPKGLAIGQTFLDGRLDWHLGPAAVERKLQGQGKCHDERAT